MDFRSSTGRNAKWSLAQTVISAATVFVLYKYLYSALGPEKLGLWAVVLASVSLGRLAELGFSTTVLRYISIHLGKGDRKHAAKILETGLISIGAPFSLVLLMISPIALDAMQYIVPPENLNSAKEILPFALATLWFGVTSSVVQSALDGCGRMDVKSKILIAGNLIYVPAAILMVKQWEIVGLAACQLLQSAIVMVLVWRASRRELPDLRSLPIKWDRNCFREILSYAAGLQIGNLLSMLFEPATKILLSRHFGLPEVAHFEMANQVVSRVRALITSATQAYLPVLSSNANNTSFARQIVSEATILTAGIGLPIMAALVVSIPIISLLWIGQIKASFIIYGWILSIGWLISTMAIPLYYYCVGAGHVRTILVSQVIMVGLNGFLGTIAAILGNGYWVAISMMTSLAISTFVVARKSLLDLNVVLPQDMFSPRGRGLVRTVIFVALVLVSNMVFSVTTAMEIHVFLNFLIHGLLLLITTYFSEARSLLMARLRRSR